MAKIKSIHAHEILDSRGNPTVEVELISDDGKFIASVPSGASTGIYEAIELRDNDKKRYNGKGVLKAVSNIEKIISPALAGIDVTKQKEIDNMMIKLDGTSNKKRLGANAILGVSMAVCRAGAFSRKIPLYKYIGELAENKKMIMPVPSFNIINGGKHAKNELQFQEFMIMPVGMNSFNEAFNIGKRVYEVLKEIVLEECGNLNIGDEGGFAPNIKNNEEALELLNKAILKSGCYEKIRIGIDVAASEFFENGKYNLSGKLSGNEMIKLYKELIEKYNLVSIEDAFDQDDWKSYSNFYKSFGKKIQIVGDDLLVTNIKRIKMAILRKACNTLLLKINQIGTISEAIDAFKLAKKAKWNVMVSHRSGETKDSFIADLAVGIGCGEIKSGAPFPIERMSKYNRLVEIEKELRKPEYFGKRIVK